MKKIVRAPANRKTKLIPLAVGHIEFSRRKLVDEKRSVKLEILQRVHINAAEHLFVVFVIIVVFGCEVKHHWKQIDQFRIPAAVDFRLSDRDVDPIGHGRLEHLGRHIFLSIYCSEPCALWSETRHKIGIYRIDDIGTEPAVNKCEVDIFPESRTQLDLRIRWRLIGENEVAMVAGSPNVRHFFD